MIDLISLITANVADEDLEFSIVSRKSRTSVFSGKRSYYGGIYILIMKSTTILVTEVVFFICFDAKRDFQFKGNDLTVIGSDCLVHNFNILCYVMLMACTMRMMKKLFIAAVQVVL